MMSKRLSPIAYAYRLPIAFVTSTQQQTTNDFHEYRKQVASFEV
jgi:hypothetical protein